MNSFDPGRYAAIDVGSHSVLLLVADLDEEGRLTSVLETERAARLGERFYVGRRLVRSARDRTLEAITDLTRLARRAGAQGIAAVGTSVLREASNGREFQDQVRHECGLPLEVITGEQEADLAYLGNLYDRRLPATDGERVVLDIGGGSTELVRGLGHTIIDRRSFAVGAARLTELYLRSDPPRPQECDAADAHIEELLGAIQPLSPGSILLGSGGTVFSLACVARESGMISADRPHGARLPHVQVGNMADLFRSLPVKFRKRVPGLEEERAEVILAGTMILHQLMAQLSAPYVIVTANGVRHGCIYSMAQRALLRK